MNPVLCTVILDPTTALLFGSALGLFSGKLIRLRPEPELGRTAKLAAVWSAWYTLSVGWFFFERADWMLVYLTDAQKVPLVPAYLLFGAIVIGYGTAGALATGVLMQMGRTGVAIAVVVAALAMQLALMVLQGDAYVHVGTFAQYVAGKAPLLESDGTMRTAMTLSGLSSGLTAVALLGLRLRKALKTV